MTSVYYIYVYSGPMHVSHIIICNNNFCVQEAVQHYIFKPNSCAIRILCAGSNFCLTGPGTKMCLEGSKSLKWGAIQVFQVW